MQNSVPDFFVALNCLCLYFDFLRLGCQGYYFVKSAWAEGPVRSHTAEIDRLRTEVAKSEDELAELKLKVEEKELLFLNFGRYSPNI